ncbi:MAG: hypothetical protein IPH86_12710 [bacterium]|nr:hypothetical protein [bacterium]
MEHSEASQHLVDYIKGTLTDAQQQAIAAHVAMHPECAETVAFLRRLEADLARHGDGLLAGYPAADTLVAHAVGDVERWSRSSAKRWPVMSRSVRPASPISSSCAACMPNSSSTTLT